MRHLTTRTLHWSKWVVFWLLVLAGRSLPVAAGAESTAPALRLSLFLDSGAPQVRFAAAEIRRACAEQGVALLEEELSRLSQSASLQRLVIAAGPDQVAGLATAWGVVPPKSRGAESYAVRSHVSGRQRTWFVLGADPAGAMYGGLDVAEAIRLGTLDQLGDTDHAPYLEKRGIKFNIPLDARTPSYSDNSDAAQQNIPEMWSFDFWREFLDEMARNRFNVLTLWSLHPFPSLVKVPEYPDVALDDVQRTTLKLDDTFSHSGSDMVRPEMLEHLETVRQMTIGEKIQFWRDVMQQAHDRGIEVYLFTWNIFTFGAEGKYGITSSQNNRVTIDYFQASVRETVLTYPLLAGFGITAGEQMPARDADFSKEQWLWMAYGEGIRDALKLQPQRTVRLVHRFHMTSLGEILGQWKDYPGPLDLSFKYAIAHMYSVTNPPFIEPVLPHLSPGRRTWLTVRNDDIYSFRWGDPEFARGFIRNMPGPDKVIGFYMGPDGYNWGREFLSTEPDSPRQLVMKKQWYSFMLWGRLSYEPDLPDELFRRTLAHRFREVPSEKLLAVWAEASRIFPQITRFFWGDIDLRWLPEACLSHPRHRGFYTVRHFMEGETMPKSGILNVGTYCRLRLAEQPLEGITPPQVAAALRGHAQAVLEGIRELRPLQGDHKELRLTLGDLEAMAHLGNYYAEKILAAVDLTLFDKTSQSEQQQSAVRHLESACEHWQNYAKIYATQYKPALYNRVGFVDIPALAAKVREDVQMAAAWKPGSLAAGPGKPRGADTPFRP